MIDQHLKFSPCGLKTEFVGEAQVNKEIEWMVIKGKVQLVYISPESLINNIRYRKMLLTEVYQKHLVALVVDEAHCVKIWGDNFRVAFAEIGNLRSLIPEHVKIMALTATCTLETLQVVKDRLSMKNPNIIALCPQRPNIFYSTRPPADLDNLTSIIEHEFIEKGNKFMKTIIFCRSYKDCADLYITLRHKLGKHFTHPPNYPDFSEFRMVELYTRVSTPEKREDDFLLLNLHCV